MRQRKVDLLRPDVMTRERHYRRRIAAARLPIDARRLAQHELKLAGQASPNHHSLQSASCMACVTMDSIRLLLVGRKFSIVAAEMMS